MLLKQQILPATLFMISLLTAIMLYNEFSFQIEDEFSPNLKSWFSRGKYFHYKDSLQVFYVYDKKQQVNADKPVILLMHGFPTSSFDYYKLWNQLSSLNEDLPYSVLAFDYLGFGFSDKPQDYEYSIFDMADMVEKLLLHLNIQSVIIVAHDISDTVAQEMLRRDNLKHHNHYYIDKCVLLNGGIFTSIYKPLISQHIMQHTYLSQLVYSKYFFRFGLFKMQFMQLFGQLGQPSTVELYDFFLNIKFNEGYRTLPMTINYMKEREQFGEIWSNALNETSSPVLFIYGPADPINPRDKFPQLLRTDLPNVKLSILSEFVGHYPQFEDSFTVSQLINNFIN